MSQTEIRKHKIKCDFGVQHYYRNYRKDIKNPQSRKVYSNVLNDYLNAIRQLISLSGYTYNMPQRLGRIELRKFKKEVFIDKDGKIVNALPINWKATKQLWKDNEKAASKKVLIRYVNEHSNGYVYKVAYLKSTANFKNKTIYKMQLNRQMRRNTEQPILTKKVDAFLLNRR